MPKLVMCCNKANKKKWLFFIGQVSWLVQVKDLNDLSLYSIHSFRSMDEDVEQLTLHLEMC
jgi:hypothetical protein